jgi:hypothetical protein
MRCKGMLILEGESSERKSYDTGEKTNNRDDWTSTKILLI